MNLLRIGYTCHDAFPSTHTNTQQIFWTTSEMARLGHIVDVCVPAVLGGPDARRTIAHHYGAPDDRVPDRLRFIALGDTDAASSAAKAWFDLRAAWRFNRRTHDVVWTRDPLAFAAALQWRVPAVFETYRPDFGRRAAFAPWRFSTIGHSRRMALLGERRLAGVIAHSQLAADAYVDAGVARERVLVAHNGFAPSLMLPRLSREEARASTGLPAAASLLVYTGHVGPQKGTGALLALAAAVPDAHLVIVGVDDRSDVQRWMVSEASRAGAKNVTLVPRVDLREVARYLYAADCLVIPPTAAPLTHFGRTVLPMKLFTYMAAGRPIVAPALPDIGEVLTDDVTGVLVPPDDLSRASAMVRDLLADHERKTRLGLAAAEHAQQYTWEARARRISSALGSWLR